jgi:hypothetical protein
MRRIITATALCAASGGVVALLTASGGVAQSTSGGQTFTVIEQSTDKDFSFIDNKPYSTRRGHSGPRISRGDFIAFSTRLVDPQGKPAGRTDASCVDTEPGTFNRSSTVFSCTGSFRLANGMLTIQTAAPITAKVTQLVITGGTGAYAGARGTITSTQNSNTKSTDVVTILP